MKNILTFTLIFSFIFAFSQKSKFKFGKPTTEELTMTECSFYPEAKSMVLHDEGSLRFQWNDDKGFQYRLERNTRIKIFDNSDKDQGDIKIRIYEPDNGGSREELMGLKAFTINMENGKAVKIKLDKADQHHTRINDYEVEVSFAFPGVQAGSVIDLSYDLVSDFLGNLRTWHFQQDIPVAYSTFIATLPEFYIYRKDQAGNVISLKTEEFNPNETFTIRWRDDVPEMGGKINSGTSTLTSRSRATRWTATDVMPLLDEPMMNNRNNLPSRIDFQLIGTQFPNKGYKDVAGSYEQYSHTLLTSFDFGGRLNQGGFANTFIQILEDKEESKLEKATSIYNWISANTSWDGYYSYVSEYNGNRILNNKEGADAGEINLTLIAALREAGLNAYPVILNTRGRGFMHPLFPNNKFINYVIALIEINGDKYLADATSGLPMGLLPDRCLNGTGWVVDEKIGGWINLKNAAKSKTKSIININIEDEEIVADITTNTYDNSTYYTLSKFESEGEEEFFNDIKEDLDMWSVSETNFSKPESQYVTSTTYKASQSIDSDIIYLKPLLQGVIISNPFTRETRYSPVDISKPMEYTTIVNILIPDGYTAELPKPALVRLPENGGKFLFNVQQSGNNINIISQTNIKKLDYSPKEYIIIKQFYELMVQNNNQVIVLKKTNEQSSSGN